MASNEAQKIKNVKKVSGRQLRLGREPRVLKINQTASDVSKKPDPFDAFVFRLAVDGVKAEPLEKR